MLRRQLHRLPLVGGDRSLLRVRGAVDAGEPGHERAGRLQQPPTLQPHALGRVEDPLLQMEVRSPASERHPRNGSRLAGGEALRLCPRASGLGARQKVLRALLALSLEKGAFPRCGLCVRKLYSVSSLYEVRNPTPVSYPYLRRYQYWVEAREDTKRLSYHIFPW